MENVLRSTRITLEMIKWEHSIFALPFALTGAMLAANGWPTLRTLGLIVLCMVAARSAAMAFNRLVDAKLDAANPRTAMRAIPAGQLSAGFVLVFTIVACCVFLVGAALLNRLTLELSPVVLVVLLGYSYLKRLTQWSHLGLGLALGPSAPAQAAAHSQPASARRRDGSALPDARRANRGRSAGPAPCTWRSWIPGWEPRVTSSW